VVWRVIFEVRGQYTGKGFREETRDLNFLSSTLVVTLDGQETVMKSTETITEQQADEEAVHEHVLTGKPLDPEVYRRVRARAEKITAELRRKYGDMNISGDLIREVRDEE
jgi:hypothetical protein